MKVQKRKIYTHQGKYPRVQCYDETRQGSMRNFNIMLKKCKKCPNFVKKDKNYVYCKKISAPYWLKDKVIEI